MISNTRLDSIVLHLERSFPHFGQQTLRSIASETLRIHQTRGDSMSYRTDSADNSASERQAAKDRDAARRDEMMAELRQQYRQPTHKAGSR